MPSVIDPWEQRSVISGIGISRIGRKTGIGGLTLTEDSARAAIADAGLTAADIDGVATMGETPIDQASAALGIEPRWEGGGMAWGGLLAPVMAACKAVADGQARHVLVYRTVQMMGGAIPIPTDGAAPTPPPAPASSDDTDAAEEAPSVMGEM